MSKSGHRADGEGTVRQRDPAMLLGEGVEPAGEHARAAGQLHQDERRERAVGGRSAAGHERVRLDGKEDEPVVELERRASTTPPARAEPVLQALAVHGRAAADRERALDQPIALEPGRSAHGGERGRRGRRERGLLHEQPGSEHGRDERAGHADCHPSGA